MIDFLKHNSTHTKNFVTVLVGNALYALAVAMFVLPCGLVTGGGTGLGLVAHHWLGVPVVDFVLGFNIVMFVLGAALMGRWFAFNTAVSTFCYPLFLRLFSAIPGIDSLTRDMMLATILAGVMIGAAIGLVIGAGASSGGMDIPPILLSKYFGLPIGMTMYLLDFAILIAQMFFVPKESILYGVVLVLLYTVVLDKVSVFGHSKIEVKIVSTKVEQIRQMILHTLDRGCTLLHAQTGYAKAEQDVILTVVTTRELSKLNALVSGIDPQAFLVIGSVSEVRGHGFTLRKIHK